MDTSVISTLNSCFWLCLVLAIVFFIVSVVLFFIFDIRSVFNIRTGRAQAKKVKEMKAANSNTGRLRVDGKTQTSKLSEEEKDAGRAKAIQPPEPGTENQYYRGGTEENTTVLSEGADNTTLLNEGSQDTTLLSNANSVEYNETSVLSENMYDYPDSQDNIQPVPAVSFKIIKKIELIHTNEFIH